MQLKNVHNSCILLYPTIWVMKDHGQCSEMLEIFVKYVVEAFDEYFGEGAFTFCLPIYDPVMMLLDLTASQDMESLECLEDYLGWASQESNLRFGYVINNSLVNFGRDCNSISAEICWRLVQREEMKAKADLRAYLVQTGLVIAQEAMDFTKEKRMFPAEQQIQPVLEGLQSLASELGLYE
mmetsp:Transcript_237/g.578  ORF Transcript_237/g.578 Transcript_237/m.578 type:complete len:181 (+) Transcript_237:1-543(+)